jgi:hypothetical protein
MRTQIASERHVLGEAQRHADHSGTEAVVESGAGLQQTGDQRPDEGADTDPEIEQREATVAARIALLVQGAE